jgi:CO/xanthine dehydrogenase Mo-binding subunit
MGIPADKIKIMLSDTHTMPMAGSLSSSQATVTIGNSILAAAEKLKKLLADHARECLRSDDQSIIFKAGDFYDDKNAQVLSWKDFARYCYERVKPLTASARITGSLEDMDLYGVTTVATVADVEADEETGEIRILQIVQAHDTGKVIHRESARGQILGSSVMILGELLMEDFIMEKGYVKTKTFAEYLIPTAMDIPEKNKAVFLENNPGNGCPNGAKGIGEHGMYSAGGAIINAIYDAIGVSITELPVTPERVLRALGKMK